MGFWLDDPATAPAIGEAITAARLVLPGATAEFTEPSSLYVVEDATGQEQLTRRRASCCNFYRVSETKEACTTCPRTSDEERRQRAAVAE